MTARPCYFVVVRWLGRETPLVYWDELPRAGVRNLVYVLRLDTLPSGDSMPASPLSQLFAVYQRLKAVGKLPPRWEPPKPQKTASIPPSAEAAP